MNIPAITDLDRYRLFALFEALESDLRALVHEYFVTSSKTEADALGSYYGQALERLQRDSDANASYAHLWDYLDLGDEIDLLNEPRKKLPEHIAAAVRTATPDLKETVPVRNRVMHRRPLLPEDIDRVLRGFTAAVRDGIPLPNVDQVCRAIASDSTWLPSRVITALPSSANVIHNLPLPEYDETGLIGRRGESEELLTGLLRRRYPVLSVLGPGGIGKTALTVDTLYRLIDHDSCPYDAILWTSLKTERLTSEGIKALREPITALSDIVPELVEPLDETFSGNIEDLSLMLEGITTLVVIDNLETASAEEVVEMVDKLPDEASFLFTSRVGLGQLERRHSIDGLSHGAATDLFRKAARSRGLGHLAVLSQDDILPIVAKVGHSPLAIKWLIQGVEAGQRLESLLEHQDRLLEFCVRNVYATLPSPARDVAQTLQILGHSASIQELLLYLEVPPDQLRRSVHELQRRSLVRTTALVGGEVAEAFELTETAEAYLRTAEAPTPDRVRSLRQQESEYLRFWNR